MRRVAIVGGGISGATLARHLLRKTNAEVHIFRGNEHNRLGTMSFEDLTVDMGCVYVSPKDDVVRDEMARLQRDGLAGRWRMQSGDLNGQTGERGVTGFR